jgi:hypothetical protein
MDIHTFICQNKSVELDWSCKKKRMDSNGKGSQVDNNNNNNNNNTKGSRLRGWPKKKDRRTVQKPILRDTKLKTRGSGQKQS